MQPITVVKHGYVVQNVLLGVVPRLIATPLNPLLLQAGKEALGYTVGISCQMHPMQTVGQDVSR